MFCSGCGCKLDGGDRYCPNCGKAIYEYASERELAVTGKDQGIAMTPSTVKVLLILAALIVAVVVAICAFLVVRGQSASSSTASANGAGSPATAQTEAQDTGSPAAAQTGEQGAGSPAAAQTEEQDAGSSAAAQTEEQDVGSSDADNPWADFPQSFTFTSGRGGWSTDMVVAADGTFTGTFHDSDMGDRGDGYPNGTRHVANFTGAFTDPVKVGEYEYTMQLKRLEITDEPGETIEDGVRTVYVTDDVYGLGSETAKPAGSFSLHLPGQPLSAFSDSAAMWLFIKNTSSEPSDFYAIVNSSDPNDEMAFKTY